jgi:3-oxoacyl-ACP reductase-like protein
MGGACSAHGRIKMIKKLLVGKSETKRPFGRPRCRWENNIRMDLRQIGWVSMDWIHLA